MKFFKATIQPKKSHPDNPEDLVFYSDQYATVKAFQDDLKKLMEEEDANHAFWFAPKVERIDEEEFKENQPAGDAQDLSGIGEELELAKEQLSEIKKQVEEVSAEIKDNSEATSEIEAVRKICAKLGMSDEFDGEILHQMKSLEYEFKDSTDERYPSVPAGTGTIEFIEFFSYLAETCQCAGSDLLNIRKMRALLNKWDHPRVNNDKWQETKKVATSGTQHYWFEYVKGNPIVMRVVKNKNGKFNISYQFESDLFIEVDKEFEKKENAIINVFGYVINDCMDSPSPEHNAIIKGIGGRDPETAIPSALMSDEEVSKYFGSASIEEKEESCGGFNDCGTCPSCKLKDFKPWEQDQSVEYKKLYGALVDVAAKYEGDKIPAISECYRTFINCIISHIAIDQFNESALVEKVNLVDDPNDFTNESIVKSLIMGARPEKTETAKDRLAKVFDDADGDGVESDIAQDSSVRMVFSASPSCKFFIELSGDDLQKVKYNIHASGKEYKDSGELTSKLEAITFALNRIKGHLMGVMDIAEVNKIINKAKSDPVGWFDSHADNSIPCEATRAKNTNEIASFKHEEVANVYIDEAGHSNLISATELVATAHIDEENHSNLIVATELKEKSDIDKFTEKVGEAIENITSRPDENDLGFDFGDSPEAPKAQDDKSDFDKMIEEYNEKIEALELGQSIVFEDMPNEIYHSVVGISSSKIKDAMISMMYYNAKHNTKEIERESGSQFDIGNVFHSICLEPDLTSKEYICEPSGDGVPQKPTSPQIEKYNEWVKLGSPEKSENPKAYPTDLMLERCGFWNDFYESTNGRYSVAADDWKLAEAMVNSAMNDEDASKLLRHPARRCETSYFKRCDTTGMIIKARPDIEVGRIIGDLKSISLRGSYDEKYLISALRKEVFNRNYHLSAAMYLDITGKDQFLWIFTNKQKGYHWTATVRASSEILERGRELYLEYKQKISDAYTSGKWPKPESIQSKRNPETGKIELAEI